MAMLPGRRYTVRYWDGDIKAVACEYEDSSGGYAIFLVETGETTLADDGVAPERQRLFVREAYLYSALEEPMRVIAPPADAGSAAPAADGGGLDATEASGSEADVPG